MDHPRVYRSFDEWLDEIENFSTRRERLLDELGGAALPWVKAAWDLGEAKAKLIDD